MQHAEVSVSVFLKVLVLVMQVVERSPLVGVSTVHEMLKDTFPNVLQPNQWPNRKLVRGRSMEERAQGSHVVGNYV